MNAARPVGIGEKVLVSVARLAMKMRIGRSFPGWRGRAHVCTRERRDSIQASNWVHAKALSIRCVEWSAVSSLDTRFLAIPGPSIPVATPRGGVDVPQS